MTIALILVAPFHYLIDQGPVPTEAIHDIGCPRDAQRIFLLKLLQGIGFGRSALIHLILLTFCNEYSLQHSSRSERRAGNGAHIVQTRKNRGLLVCVEISEF